MRGDIYIALCAHCLALPLTGMGCAHAIALSVNMCTLNCVHIEPGASETFKLLGCQKLAQIAGVSETCLILGCQKPVQIVGVSETC